MLSPPGTAWLAYVWQLRCHPECPPLATQGMRKLCVNLRVVPFASPEARDDTFGADFRPRTHVCRQSVDTPVTTFRFVSCYLLRKRDEWVKLWFTHP